MGALDRILKRRAPDAAIPLPRRIAAILRKFGSDAHLYMPGVGRIDGFTTGNYLESTGNTNASVDGAVGLVLDAAGIVGAELTVGGDFSSAANWGAQAGFTISGGSLYINAGGGAITNTAGQAAVIGKTYRLEFEVTSFTSGRIGLFMGDGAGVSAAAVGKYVGYVVATSTNKPQVYITSAGTVCTVDNVSVKEVTGTHATQATTANKPTLRRGIVNLLTYSNDLTNAGYVKVAGSATANSYTPDTSNGLHRFQSIATTIISGAPYTYAVRAQANGYRYLYINGAAGANTGQVCFDLQTGTVAATTNGTGSIQAVGDGSYICAVSATSSGTSNTCLHQVNDTGVAADRSFSGDGVSGIYSYARGLFSGTLTAQQILDAGGIPLTTTAPASSSAGKYAWQFDGSNDVLTAPVNTGVAGYLATIATPSALGWKMMAGSGAQLASNTGVRLGIAGSSNKFLFESASGSSGAQSSDTGTVEIGKSYVVSGRWNSTTQSLRVNGVEKDSRASAAAASANGFAIGAGQYGTLSDYFAGSIGLTLLINGEISVSDAKAIDKWLGSLAGVQIP